METTVAGVGGTPRRADSDAGRAARTLRWEAIRRVGAAVCLPAALAAVWIGCLPQAATAGARPSVANQILAAAKTSYVILTLYDGHEVRGTFDSLVGDWSDPTDSDLRYETWRSAHGEEMPRLAEPVCIVRSSGDTLRGVLRGFTGNVIALGTEREPFARPVLMSDVATLLPRCEPSPLAWETMRDSLLHAPSLAAVALRQGTHAVIVPRELVAGARGGEPVSHSDVSPWMILLGAGALVALVIVCTQEANDAGKGLANDMFSSCTKSSGSRIDEAFGDATVSRGVPAWVPGPGKRP